MIHELIYHSKESKPLSDEALAILLEKSRIKNKTLDITGCLIYHEQKFIQILEGEKEILLKLYEAIQQDTRHQNVTLVDIFPKKERLFSQWNMYYHNLDNPEVNFTGHLMEQMQFYIDILKK